MEGLGNGPSYGCWVEAFIGQFGGQCHRRPGAASKQERCLNGKQISQLGRAETGASLETGQSAPVLPHVISDLGGQGGVVPIDSRFGGLALLALGVYA